MKIRTEIFLAFISFVSATLFAAEIYRPVSVSPSAPAREFRGAWIATVGNIDWPSKPGLSVAEQKAELRSLLDTAVQLKLNAVVFQVRPECDAFYASPIEPWSEYLTGVQGRPPQPFYDPLAFAIEEAHKRGLELHAWFNPFRARDSRAKSPPAANDISRTHPEFVRKYGDQLWLDPGEPAAREYVLRVIMDVVKRYDVDGVHFDDYFYPYPVVVGKGHDLNFPDEATWKKFGIRSGLSRANWRRQNINEFIQSVYQNIKAAKPWVKFGVSPFGIWRPGNPPQIRGFDADAKLYADSRLWLANGWVDYFSPQLYWPVNSTQQSFPVLLNWWARQNVKKRNLWPGLDPAAGVRLPPEEIARQIQATRAQSGASGEIFFHLRTFQENAALANVIQNEYSQPALVPASPWLGATPPEKPKLSITESRAGLRFQWESSDGKTVRLWVFQLRTGKAWTTEILPANQTSRTFYNSKPETISIRAVDRIGNLSAPAAFAKILPAHGSRLKR
ncbi:MAG: glycoside hydrolase family 10 protein [Limisphaerales bacterium]